jgi:5-formyltetrahydrofolate cyclo-ligase
VTDTEVREQLRREALSRRNDLAENLRIAFDHLIRKRTLYLIKELRVHTIHSYLSFRSEVDTITLVKVLESDGLRVVAPVVIIDGGVSSMEHYLLTDTLETGLFGLPEPQRTTPIDSATIEAVIVPLVAYDGTGMRLGYGKGFYDRFLSTLSPSVKKIGLAYSIQEVDSIPRQPHDQLLNYIVTEQSLIQP